MKEKLYRQLSLLRADLSTEKGLFCFVCATVASTFFIGATLTGGLFFVGGYAMSQVPAKELSQLQSMTLAQLLPLLAPTLHMYLQLVVCVSPPMALLGEIIRSIRQQERKLLTVA